MNAQLTTIPRSSAMPETSPIPPSSLTALTIRVARVRRYGAPHVVELGLAPRPALRPGTVRIAVQASTVTAGDARVRAARVPRGMGLLLRLALGWSTPRQPILGTELTGVVTEVGAGVTAFQPGDAVIAVTGAALGAHADEVVYPADGLIVARPARLAIDSAAALSFGGMTALHYLRATDVKAGERVLVVGASGAVGLAVVQLAVLAGAEVTAICSAQNAPLVREQGVGRASGGPTGRAPPGLIDTIDYRTHDVFANPTETRRWDVIIDTVGTVTYGRCRARLSHGGRLARVICDLPGLLAAPFQGRLRGHRVVAGVCQERKEDLERLTDLATRGDYRVVIDSVYPFEQLEQAHARVDTGRKRGNVVVRLR